MKQNTTILILFVFLLSYGLAEGQIRPYIGYTSINNINIGITKSINELTSIGLEGGFFIPFNKQKYYNGTTAPLRILNEMGVDFASYVNFATNENLERFFGIRFEYSNLKSNKFIYDGYRNWTRHFEGQTEYSEFKEKYNNFSILFSFHKELDWEAMCYSYFSFGIKLRNVSRTYSIEGTDTYTYVSDRKEKLIQYAPILNIGVRFYLTRLKSASP